MRLRPQHTLLPLGGLREGVRAPELDLWLRWDFGSPAWAPASAARSRWAVCTSHKTETPFV